MSSERNRTLILSAFVVAIVVASIVASCGRSSQSTPPPQGEGLSSFARDGVLKVAIVPAPPISAFDPISKRAEGYAIDVIDAIGRKSNLRVQHIPSDWATMGAALASHKADVVIGPIFMTEGRAKEYSFTDSLFAYAIVAVVPARASQVQTLADFQKPGLRIAVGRGGFDSEFVSNTMPHASVSAFPPDDPNLPMLEILAGRADIAFADYATASKFVAEHPETKIGLDSAPVSLQYAAFMLRQGDTNLKDFLNLALLNLDLSGALSSIDAKYADQRTWYARTSSRPELVK